MHVSCVTDLSEALFERWRCLHDADSARPGPFLHPAYARAVARVRPDVEVAVIVEGGRAVGFVPYQRSRFDVGGPVGSRLCDLAGAVVESGAAWDPRELGQAAGLRLLRLPHVPVTPWLRPCQGDPVAAPYLDLSGGFEAYRAEIVASGSDLVGQLRRKARRAERDVGPLRFQWHTTDDRVFEALLAWKRLQRKATRTPNILDLGWARALLEHVRTIEAPGFAGVLSALYIGDTLAAAHLGMRTHRVLHYWVPAYNQDLARYSPGLLCLMEVAMGAAGRDIERIDLGTGDERYKLRTSTGSLPVATVTVSTGMALRALSTALDGIRTWSRGTSLGDAAKTAGRALRRGSYALRSSLGSKAE